MKKQGTSIAKPDIRGGYYQSAEFYLKLMNMKNFEIATHAICIVLVSILVYRYLYLREVYFLGALYLGALSFEIYFLYEAITTDHEHQ